MSTTYRVMLHGMNFRLKRYLLTHRYGFYTTRFVQAASEKEAEQLATGMVRQDSYLLKRLRNEPSDSPMIYLDDMEIWEDDLPAPNIGFTFYRY
ncbi:hypothetical protein PQU92_18225 [Asticcacaulis sp. BYS171W]|uniref:Uncharacterized protein n=1 Tax=Asticcacaulis aquaticus TaxID=2984212 RepID=A0ABT5HZ07_9CAUL|nr:hypothetical protein [Asticcacaulis aquaticus]MDC7685224.1 hypothetical protein [Asticcacaulis aquaticus]